MPPGRRGTPTTSRPWRAPFSGVVVPKAESTAGLAAITGALDLASAPVMAAVPGVGRLTFGSIDFCTDLGCADSREALLPARHELVRAPRLRGLVAPIDGVTTAIDDARHARELGFSGKFAIHPRQIAAIRAGFLPDAAKIAWAWKVLESGDGAVAVDGAMVDEPVRIRARSILARSADISAN